jgi:hypothetical protein
MAQIADAALVESVHRGKGALWHIYFMDRTAVVTQRLLCKALRVSAAFARPSMAIWNASY